MPRSTLLALFYLASFLQAGAYGLTFLLPRLFAEFGSDEKTVGAMLAITALSTLVTVYYSGHLADRFGRTKVLGLACLAIAAALAGYGLATGPGSILVTASLLLGAGWGLTYALSPVVLTGLTAPEERVRYFALLSVAVMAGFGLSPVLAAQMELAGLPLEAAFYATALLCALAALLFFALIGPIRAGDRGAGRANRSQLSLRSIQQILASPARLPVTMVLIGASVFAGMNNFQTVFADQRGLDYAQYFLAYTLTVVLCRLLLARFTGGRRPYLMIAALQYVMFGSVVLFAVSGGSAALYLVTAALFGIGYGVSYPILAAMAANDAFEDLLPQTLQLFALSYFVGIFGFPLLAGWILVDLGGSSLLGLVAVLAALEATLALRRGWAG
ncbi:MFS transporter [Pseudophaeobacter sp. EL27]|uniref:MFS transporter n=1 Tax=Pseudophaeobacter sp. EL27 TaxID=2107580 RepID=UPI000EFA84CF|nr:MFS transporter [Pseudophaeobacter sp. EL27]